MPKIGADPEKIIKIKDAMTNKELNMTEIAKKAKMPSATVYVYLTTFMKDEVKIIRSYGTTKKKSVCVYKLL